MAQTETTKAAEAKKRLLEESVRLIEETGLGALSFREMARRAGVSHQAPYHHFANREGILIAIAHEGFLRLDARLVAASEAAGSPGERLRAVIRAYMVFARDNPVHFRIMFRPELAPLAQYPEPRAAAALTFRRLADAVAACHPDAATGDPRFLEVVNALWAAAHGVATLLLDGPVLANSPQMSLEGFVETAARLYGEAGAATKIVP
jgi:AcrR family transcriptional regulator